MAIHSILRKRSLGVAGSLALPTLEIRNWLFTRCRW